MVCYWQLYGLRGKEVLFVREKKNGQDLQDYQDFKKNKNPVNPVHCL
jgi:hypothetical protein